MLFQEVFIHPRNQGIVCSSSPEYCRLRTSYTSVGSSPVFESSDGDTAVIQQELHEL